MINKKCSSWRNVLAGLLAFVFLFAGSALAAPEEAGVRAVLPVPGDPAGAGSSGADAADIQMPEAPVQPGETGQLSPRPDADAAMEVRSETRDASWSFIYDQSGNVITGYNGTLPAELIIPDGITGIRYGAFQGNDEIVSVMIPDSVTEIGSIYSYDAGAFQNCRSLKKVIIGNGARRTGTNAFTGCSDLEQVMLGTALEAINSKAFYGCSSLQSIDIPDTKADLFIGDEAFRGSGISSVTMGNRVKSIGIYAFAGCQNLSEVTLGSKLETIRYGAFEGCPELMEIVIPDSVAEIGSIYSYDTGVFENCRSLKTVVIGSGAKRTGTNTFRGCADLERATLGTALESINFKAFYGCGSLESIAIPDTKFDLHIGDEAFRGSGISSVTMGNRVKSIGIYAFAGCTNLNKVTLGSKLETIRYGAFADCPVLAEIVIPGSLLGMGSTYNYDTGTFQNCRGLLRAAIRNGAKGNAGQNTFKGCSSLEEVFLSRDLDAIGSQAFANCPNLRRILFGGSEADWKKIAGQVVLNAETVIVFNAPEPEWAAAAAPVPTATPSATPSPTATATPSATPSSTATATPTATPSPSVTAAPTATSSPAATPSATPTPLPSITPSPKPTPGIVPAPEIPAVSGYQGGLLNGRIFYTKASNASMLFYQKRSSGSLGRVSVPYVTASRGTRYYPINWGGTILYPRLENGTLSAYCLYANKLEIPALKANAAVSSGSDVLQQLTLNGRPYYARTSGAGMLFYQKRSSGALGRVSAPYVTDKTGTRYYPVNCGGIVLVPQLKNGVIAGYTAGSASVLIPVN